MTTNRTTRHADAFDAALNGGPADAHVAALVAVAGALATVPLRPAPAFRESLRAKLVAEATSLAASSAAPVPAGAARSLPRFLHHPAMHVATGGLAAAVAVTGVGVGAHRSLPGDSLYGVKRRVEALRAALAGTPTARAGALLDAAQTRISEVRALLARDDLDRIAGVLGALDAELREATATLVTQVHEGSREAYDLLRGRVERLTGELVALLPRLPASARPAVSSALGILNVAAARIRTAPALPISPSLPAGPSPTTVPATPAVPVVPPVTISPSVPSVPTVKPSVPTVSPPPPTGVPVPTPTPHPTLPVELPPILP